VDLEALHHFLLLWNSTHQLSKVLWLHISRIILAAIHNVLNLPIDIVEGLQKVHISQLYPLFVCITQLHVFILDPDISLRIDAIFNVNSIRLVEKVMDNWRDKIKGAITDQKTSTRLFNPILILTLLEQDRG
jgi:hypothetical protein